MTRAEILAGIAEVARVELALDPAAVEPRARLVEDLGLDSLKLLTLAAAVENHFRVALAPEDDARIRTVADLVAALAEKLGGDPP